MSPKYVLFILPLIIIWIGTKIESISIKNNHKVIQIFLISLSFVFFLFNINNSPIDRPPTKEVLSEIVKHEVKYIITTEYDVFKNYLETKTIVVKNNLIILKSSDVVPKKVDEFWFLCLNNTRFGIGKKALLINKPKIEKRCLDFMSTDKTFTESLPIANNTQDYLIRKFKKK